MNSKYETIKHTHETARNALLEFYSSNELTYSQTVDMKSIISSQKFSRWFQKELARVLGHAEGPEFASYDALNKSGATQEYKYATYSEDRGASFPQILNLDFTPDTYVIGIYFGSEIRMYEISGKEFHNSIIRFNGKRAHANNKNQLRINVKKNSQEMDYLENHYSKSLTDKVKRGKFSPIK